MVLYNSGAEAPRNSLESEDGTLSSISKQDSFKIPVSLFINLDFVTVININSDDIGD